MVWKNIERLKTEIIGCKLKNVTYGDRDGESLTAVFECKGKEKALSITHKRLLLGVEGNNSMSIRA